MPAPDIDALPPVPLRTEAAGTFTPKAETFLDSLDTFRTQVNAFGDYLDGLGLDPAEIPDAVTDLTMATARLIGRTTAGAGAAEELTAAQVRAFLLTETWDFNFAADGYQVIRASEAMTITQQATTGTGTVAYEKSTAAAPDTFSSTSSPITLEAGAKLKVTASSVTATYAVHLERTA